MPAPPPPPRARRFIRYLLGFGVSVAVGLAPLLGNLKIPLFEPLLNILPPDERAVAVPLAAMIMGVVAVAVQWYGSERLPKRKLRRVFTRTLLSMVIVVFLLFAVNVFVVVRVPVANDQTAVLLHGFGPPTCGECLKLSDSECVKSISFDPSRIEHCWGSLEMRIARIALTLSYLAAMMLFGALVGLVTIKEES